MGFNSYHNGSGRGAFIEYAAYAAYKPATVKHGPISRHEAELRPLDIVCYLSSEVPNYRTIIPELQGGVTIPATVHKIMEWENFHNGVAIVSAQGKQTYALPFLATDYALHQDRYRTSKEIDVHINGIAFVLDVHTPDRSSEASYADNFTAYMHSSQLTNYACIDVIAEVESVREVDAIGREDGGAYLAKMRLITKEDEPDFFTIDVYAVQETLRFEKLTAGMKVTGILQLQGRLAE